MEILITVLIALIAGNGFLAKQMANVAAMKGYGEEVHAWAWCFWLGILGYIYVLSLPDKVTQLLWSSVFVTLMAKKYRFMQFELDMVFDTH